MNVNRREWFVAFATCVLLMTVCGSFGMFSQRGRSSEELEQLERINGTLSQLERTMAALHEQQGSAQQASTVDYLVDPGANAAVIGSVPRDGQSLDRAVLVNLQASLEKLTQALVERTAAEKKLLSLQPASAMPGATHAAFAQTSGETRWEDVDAFGQLLVAEEHVADGSRNSLAFATRAHIVERFGQPTHWSANLISYSRGFGQDARDLNFVISSDGLVVGIQQSGY